MPVRNFSTCAKVFGTMEVQMIGHARYLHQKDGLDIGGGEKTGRLWNNTWDEIRQIAVMKDGKNLCPRIGCLLRRKYLKECNVSCFDRRNIAIKKTAWTPEKERKRECCWEMET